MSPDHHKVVLAADLAQVSKMKEDLTALLASGAAQSEIKVGSVASRPLLVSHVRSQHRSSVRKRLPSGSALQDLLSETLYFEV